MILPNQTLGTPLMPTNGTTATGSTTEAAMPSPTMAMPMNVTPPNTSEKPKINIVNEMVPGKGHFLMRHR